MRVCSKHDLRPFRFRRSPQTQILFAGSETIGNNVARWFAGLRRNCGRQGIHFVQWSSVKNRLHRNEAAITGGSYLSICGINRCSRVAFFFDSCCRSFSALLLCVCGNCCSHFRLFIAGVVFSSRCFGVLFVLPLPPFFFPTRHLLPFSRFLCLLFDYIVAKIDAALLARM